MSGKEKESLMNRSRMKEKIPLFLHRINPQCSTDSDNGSEFAQDYVPIRDIVGGAVFLEDGSIVNIIEILPVNYVEKTDERKDMIADIFGNSFRQFPSAGHIKVMNVSTDLTPFERHIRRTMANETDKRLLNRVEDYIENVKKIKKHNSIHKRFFFIYEYTGDDDGKKSDDVRDILYSLRMEQLIIMNAFTQMGNVALSLDNDPDAVADILYQFYNPSSCESVPFDMRKQKVISSANWCIRHGSPITHAPVEDFFAPRGIRFGKWDYMVMDGVYHTYLALKDNSYPNYCEAGWLGRILDKLDDGDLDIHFRKIENPNISYMLDRTNIISKAIAINNAGAGEKVEENMSRANNAKWIKDRIDKDGESLYEVSTIITLRAKDYKTLKSKKTIFLKEMKGYQYYFEDSFLRTPAYFRSVMPFNYIDSELYRHTKRNMTESSLSSLYCFTAYEKFDPLGCVMGTIVKNNSMFSINNFDTKVYPNPHIFIAGTTGAGKTYTELMLTSRLRMLGARILFILPLKGHEYKDMVISMGGAYYLLCPGGKVCINICEIRPEGKFNPDNVSEEEQSGGIISLLSKKISSITTWIDLLVKDLTVEEEGEINLCLAEMYRQFGITEDNDSIYEDKRTGKIKKMPILQDVYDSFSSNPCLSKRILSILKPWVFGSCSNFNGQTNIDLENKMIAFDVNEDLIGEKLLPAYMYIAYDVAYDMAKRDEYEYCAIALDEVWKMLVIPSCAKMIFKSLKILRGYGACAITATQDIEDCSKSEYGRSILTLSAIKIYLKVSLSEIKALQEAMVLSEENKELIQVAPRGYGFVCSDTEQVFVRFISSALEEEIYTTDIKRKRELKAIRENQTFASSSN